MKASESTENKKLIIARVVFCVIATIGVLKYNNMPDNFALVVILFSCYLLIYEKFSARYKYYALFYSIFLSLLLTIGGQLDAFSVIAWDSDTVFRILTFAFSLYLPIYRIMGFLEKTILKKGRVFSKKDKMLIYLIIVSSNLLIYLALFPGIYGWDSALQSYRAIYGGVTSHWSVPLGYMFGFLLKIGKNVFGDYGVGMAIAMLLQMLFVSFVYAKVVFFINKRFKSNYCTVTTLCFFVMMLLFGAMSIYSTQDTIFGAIFALIFIELCELSYDSAYWNNRKNIIKYIILGILLCLCRNNGVYVLLLVAVISFFVMKKGEKKKVLFMIIPVVGSFVYSGVILNIMGIPNSTAINEMMSVPSQQIARVYTLNGGSISNGDKEKIEYYYDKVEKFKEYKDFMAKADKTKGALNADKVKDNMMDYFLLWLRVGVHSPRNYIEAFLLNSLGTWYPGKDYDDPRAHIGYIEYDMNTLWNEYDGEYAETKIERNSKLPFYEEFLAGFIHDNNWQDTPLLSIIYSIGSYFVLTVFSIMMIVYRKNYKMLVPMCLVVGLYVTVLLGPVAIFRYCYPVLIVAPIIVLSLFRKIR